MISNIDSSFVIIPKKVKAFGKVSGSVTGPPPFGHDGRFCFCLIQDGQVKGVEVCFESAEYNEVRDP